jgi:hypothetical protein
MAMGNLVGRHSADVVVLNGGPLDGREHLVDPGAGELRVAMTDGQQHLYARTDITQSLPDGRTAVVYEWKGRRFGLK